MAHEVYTYGKQKTVIRGFSSAALRYDYVLFIRSWDRVRPGHWNHEDSTNWLSVPFRPVQCAREHVAFATGRRTCLRLRPAL